MAHRLPAASRQHHPASERLQNRTIHLAGLPSTSCLLDRPAIICPSDNGGRCGRLRCELPWTAKPESDRGRLEPIHIYELNYYIRLLSASLLFSSSTRRMRDGCAREPESEAVSPQSRPRMSFRWKNICSAKASCELRTGRCWPPPRAHPDAGGTVVAWRSRSHDRCEPARRRLLEFPVRGVPHASNVGGPGRTRTCNQTVMSGRL